MPRPVTMTRMKQIVKRETRQVTVMTPMREIPAIRKLQQQMTAPLEVEIPQIETAGIVLLRMLNFAMPGAERQWNLITAIMTPAIKTLEVEVMPILTIVIVMQETVKPEVGVLVRQMRIGPVMIAAAVTLAMLTEIIAMQSNSTN
jgi:hypothetical protein